MISVVDVGTVFDSNRFVIIPTIRSCPVLSMIFSGNSTVVFEGPFVPLSIEFIKLSFTTLHRKSLSFSRQARYQHWSLDDLTSWYAQRSSSAENDVEVWYCWTTILVRQSLSVFSEIIDVTLFQQYFSDYLINKVDVRTSDVRGYYLITQFSSHLSRQNSTKVQWEE